MPGREEDDPERRTVSMADAAGPAAAVPWPNDGLAVVDPGLYSIGAEIARGGAGRIRVATDRRLGRPVAIKDMHGAPSPGRDLRFVREALISARLQHPAIVNVHEAGRWPTGEPFYAMKLVAGRSLGAVIAEKASLPERLALLPHVSAAADAIAYAHSTGVIHRDLKPANVLVGDFGETVVIDWGLAKDLRAPGGDDPAEPVVPADEGLTVAGTAVGTPAYMAPEQAAGGAVDERVDVYALGALLYHLLAGRPPYSGPTPAEVVARVQSEPPPPLGELLPDVPGDLLAIVEKAMARQPAARYPTARELAADLRRFQTGQLVGAHRYSPGQLVRRWIRRHRAVVGVAGVLLAALAATGLVSVRRIVSERDRAERERARAVEQERSAQARAAALILQQARSQLDRDPTSTLAWLKRYPEGGEDRAELRRLAVEAVGRGVARHVWAGHAGGVRTLAVAPDGKSLAAGGQDGAIRLWDVAGGGGRLLGREGGPIVRLVYSPDGARLLSASEDMVTRIWDVAGGGSVAIPGCDSAFDVTFGPGGLVLGAREKELLACDAATGAARPIGRTDEIIDRIELAGARVVVGSGGALFVADPAGGRLARLPGGTPVHSQAVSPDGHTVAGGGDDGTVWLWELSGGPPRALRGHTGAVAGLAFSPDGKRLVSVGADPAARLWDVASGAALASLALGAAPSEVAFAPGGEQAAIDIGGPSVRVWDLATGDSRHLGAHRDATSAIAWAGGDLVTASWDGTVRLWRPARQPARVLRASPARIKDLQLSADAGSLLAVGVDGAVRLWDVARGQAREIRRCRTACWADLSPDGKLIAVGADDDVADLRDAGGRVVGGLGKAAVPAFSPDGRRLLLSDRVGSASAARVLDVASGAERSLGAGDPLGTPVFSSGGRWAASMQVRDGAVWLADLSEARSQVLRGQPAWNIAPAFSDDGALIATGGSDQTIWLWDAAAGRGRLLGRRPGAVLAVAVAPDGRTVASGGGDWTITLWPTGGGAGRELRGHAGPVREVQFSPDGHLLVSAGDDHTVRVWDVESGDDAIVGGQAGDPLTADAIVLELSRDGRLLAAGGHDGAIHIYSLAPPPAAPRAPAEQAAWLSAASSAEIVDGEEPATPSR